MVSKEFNGEIIVYGWAPYRIVVGGEVLSETYSIRCKRTNTKTVGDCSINVLDPDGAIRDALSFRDEIEIYINDPDNPYEANKVWGGFLIDTQYVNSSTGMQMLNVSGKEYAHAWFDKIFTKSYPSGTDVATIASEIITDDGTLLATGLPASTDKTLQIDFDKERHWDALKKACDVVNYEFGCNLNMEGYIRDKAASPFSPDSVELGQNLIGVSQENIGKDYVSRVVVQGNSTAITATSEDAGGNGRTIYQISPDITDASTAQSYADAILSEQNSVAARYKLSSPFLPYTEPNHLLNVSVAGTGLSTYYKVIDIEHTVNERGWISSTSTLNYAGLDQVDIITKLYKQYTRSEKQVWA